MSSSLEQIVSSVIQSDKTVTDGRFATINDAWTSALMFTETLDVENTRLNDTMNGVLVCICTAIIILGVIVWNSKGGFKIRVTITLVAVLFVAVLMYNLMGRIQRSLLRLDREANGIVRGFAHAMQMAGVLSAKKLAHANQGIITSELRNEAMRPAIISSSLERS